MSVTYASTSFGTVPEPAESYGERPARHQRAATPSPPSSARLPHVVSEPPSPPPHAQDVMRMQYDQIGAFFGSQRSSQSARTSRSSAARTLPPYDPSGDTESLPSYSKIEEYDASLNRKLFIYGFLFFPLWIAGIIAPFVRPHHDPTKDNRSKEDQQADDTSMRSVEMRWARRCGLALFVFIVLVAVAVVVGVTVSNRH
ncbi:hypothetical protein DFH11DRAFT_1590666 [Phellopilus nigrolimitatus]|nr:hypothetical protein DFH11DRAFT_1590666 [Phellopilus nigrolimitatus]